RLRLSRTKTRPVSIILIIGTIQHTSFQNCCLICFCFVSLRYNSLVTGQRAKGIIAVCWILSVVIGLTPMLGWNRRVAAETNSSCPQGMTECLFEKVVTMDYMVYFNFFGCVLIPLFAMLAIYAWIFMAARRQLRQMEQKLVHLQGYAHREGSSSRSTLQREVHAAKSLAIIVGLFAVCWLPLHIINCFTLFCPQCGRPQDWVMYLAIMLSHANSAVNPFIYAYRIRDFRHTFRRIIRKHFLWHENRLTSGNRNGGMAASSAPISVIEASCTVSNGYVLDVNPIPGMVSCDKFTKQMPSTTRPQMEFQDLGYSLNGALENSFPVSSTQIFSLHTGEEVPSIRDHVEIMTVKDCSAITNVHVRCLVPIRTRNSSDLAEVS
uniref:Adenosine A2a receptor n=1 Tax=Cyprinus carpio TaxID=7962 RepID=A0A8C2J4X8_CYPCA